MTAAVSHEPGLLLGMYQKAGLIREFEERLKWLVDTGVPTGPVHYYTGQEAVAAGVCGALEVTDWIASTHRGHGHCIAKGANVAAMMAELYGKSTGTNKAKGGSMHITDASVGILGVNPIVGAGVTHATGAALSAKVRKTSQVAATFFGDGGASQGSVHEAMNLAAVWTLPVIFVCENNGYADATPVEYAVPIANIADRAAGYNMPGVIVDGMDIVAVYEATDAAVRRARDGKGPTLIECKTYRYYGHHQGDDPLRYRLAEEEKTFRDRDCLQNFRRWATGNGVCTTAELDVIDLKNKTLIDEAVKFAEQSPLPDPAELYTDIYVPSAQ